MYYTNHEIEEIQQSRQLAVFGAGAVAEAVVVCLMSAPYELSVECCIVSDQKGNPKNVAGIPVVDIPIAEKKLDWDVTIIAAIAEKNLESVKKSLRRFNRSRIIFLTYEGDLWSLLRGNYYWEWRLAKGKAYLALEEELQNLQTVQAIYQKQKTDRGYERSIRVYTVRSHFDREIREDVLRYSWETPIQAGAALTDRMICDIRDDMGDNISCKNRKYCELTALYWIWKNDNSAYVGLGHYRRHFELNKDMLREIPNSGIDVVLTIPIFDYPDVKTVYCRDHVENDWLVMMDALKVLHPAYVSDAVELEKGNFYYAYNMFIMRRGILEDYCAWLFPILAYCEEHCLEKDDDYQNRYIGFLAEHLMAIYFLHHEDDYKIVHARKHFILI